MYSGTSYGGNPYALGGYRASPTNTSSPSASPAPGATSSSTATTTPIGTGSSGNSSWQSPSPVLPPHIVTNCSLSTASSRSSCASPLAGIVGLSSPCGSTNKSVSSPSYIMGNAYGGLGVITSSVVAASPRASAAGEKKGFNAPSPLSVEDSPLACSSSVESTVSPLAMSPASSSASSSSPSLKNNNLNDASASSSSNNTSSTSSLAGPYALKGTDDELSNDSLKKKNNNNNGGYQPSCLGASSSTAARKKVGGASSPVSSSSYTASAASSRSKNNIKVEVVETDMAPGADGPIYHIKLDMNGRTYVAARHHHKLRSLVDVLRSRGYRIWRPFPEVEDMMQSSTVKVESGNSLVEALPFYEGFGYSIKSLASTMLRSSSAAGLRKRRSMQVEQISQRIDSFLKTIFLENDDLQYEQEVYQFFWEPLEKKLQPVMEEGLSDEEEEDDDEEVEVELPIATASKAFAARSSTNSSFQQHHHQHQHQRALAQARRSSLR